MQTQNNTRTLLEICTRVLLALAIVVGLSFVPSQSAQAITSEEMMAQADALRVQLDALQTQLNQVTSEYQQATEAHDAAVTAMDEAQKRIEASEKRIAELQVRLGDRAVSMYKTGGSASFLDVILGSSSFDDFLTSWDAFQAITSQDAELVQESKDVRAEAQAAHEEYSAQEQTARESMDKAAASKAAIETTTADMQSQIATISAEAQELAAKEAAAEEAAVAAAQAAAAAAGDNTDYSALAGASVVSGSGILSHPCPSASISSTFGPRWGTVHKGVDFAASEGTPYYAADSGTVMYATNGGGWNGGAGNWVVITHGNGMVTKYMHSSVTLVTPGQHVERGQNIGLVGNTGDSSGAHLHFQLEINGTAVDPLGYI